MRRPIAAGQGLDLQRLATIAAMMLLCSPTWATTPDAPTGHADAENAVWTPKRVHFVYQGFTTHYSCEGLADKVRKALLELGAAKDLKVREGPCTRPSGGPEQFPNVDVRMNVLQPLTASSADQTAKPLPAHWQRVELKLDDDPLSEAGDCELVEQIKQTFLPLFATRNVDYHSSCVAHQVAPGGTWLRADVLIADQKSKPDPH